MKEKQAVTREYKPRYQEARKKEKTVLLDEFVRLTGYRRKSAIRVLSRKPVGEILIYNAGKAEKLKPEKKRPANRKGKRIYTGEVIECLRMVRTFFRHKCGKILSPLIRQQTGYIADRAVFKITPEIREKLMKISPATIERYLKKDKDALRMKGKSLTKPVTALKMRIPLRTFYSGRERKTPGFIHGLFSPSRTSSGSVHSLSGSFTAITAPNSLITQKVFPAVNGFCERLALSY